MFVSNDLVFNFKLDIWNVNFWKTMAIIKLYKYFYYYFL